MPTSPCLSLSSGSPYGSPVPPSETPGPPSSPPEPPTAPPQKRKIHHVEPKPDRARPRPEASEPPCYQDFHHLSWEDLWGFRPRGFGFEGPAYPKPFDLASYFAFRQWQSYYDQFPRFPPYAEGFFCCRGKHSPQPSQPRMRVQPLASVPTQPLSGKG